MTCVQTLCKRDCGRKARAYGMCAPCREAARLSGEVPKLGSQPKPAKTPPGRTWRRREHLIEDVEWLLESSEAPFQIAKRVGYGSMKDLREKLVKYGRNDLAERIDYRSVDDDF